MTLYIKNLKKKWNIQYFLQYNPNIIILINDILENNNQDDNIYLNNLCDKVFSIYNNNQYKNLLNEYPQLSNVQLFFYLISWNKSIDLSFIEK